MGRQRDLLPLPLLDDFDWKGEVSHPHRSGLSTGAYRRRVRKSQNLSMTNEVISAINAMAGFKSPKAGAPTVNQHHSMTSMLKHISSLPRADECMSMREAVRELLQCNPFSPYDLGAGSGTTVRPYEKHLVSLPEVGSYIKDATDLVDDTGKRMLEAYDSVMLRSENEVDFPIRVVPYMDESLKQSSDLYHGFIADLAQRNMVDFTYKSFSVVTPFFVVKKSGKLRLVLDCRATNELFQHPPDIAMPAGYSFSQLQMKPNDTLYIAQTDIKDYFYSIGLPEGLRPYFTFPQVDLKKIFPEDPRCRGVEGPVLIHPCMKVVPMGWNWAMYIAQPAHQHQAMLAAKVGVESVVVDGRPVPPLDEKNHTLLIPYADNLNIVSIDKQKVQNMKNVITDHMNSIGFITHEEQSAETRAEALGFLVDGQGGRILPRPHERDRARKVLLWLARQPKVNGQMIERVIGHCIHFFMLRRECLSVFRAIYDFKQAHYNDRVTLWKTAAEECRQAAALLLVCYADLKREWHSEVTCSDASLTGTGVCAATFDVQQVCYHGSQRELWRYKSKDAAHNARDHFAKADPFSDISTVSKISAGSAWDDFQINDEFVEIPRSFLQSSEWETLFSSRMQMPEHITLLEGRGVVQSLRHKTRAQNSFHKRHLHLGDNLGMTLCLDRGRAKNKQLLFQCRRVAAFNIAADIEVHHRWIPSELNPADAPSRRYEGEAHEVSKRQKKKVIESILYPDRANHFETEEAGKILEKHLGGFESNTEALPGVESAGQASRHQEEDPRHVRCGASSKAKETDGGTRCLSSTRWSEFSGTGRGVSKNCQRLSVQDSCVPSVLSPQQTVDQICSTDRHMSDDILRTMFQGWHEHQRGHKVPRCNHRFETRAITQTHVGPLASCSQGMAQLGPRNLSPTRSLAGGSTSGIQDGGGQQGDPCPVHPNYVCNVLPSFRTSTTPKKGPSGIKGPWHSVVASPEQVRGHGAVKNRHARREHDPRQQRNPLVRYDAEDDCHKADVQPPFQHRLPRAQRVLEEGTEVSQSPRRIHGNLPAETLRGILGPVQGLQKPVGGQTLGKMGMRHQHAPLRKARNGHAKVHKPVTKDTAKCPGSNAAPKRTMRRCCQKTKTRSSGLICLELFSGSGHLSKKLRKHGLTVETWDIFAGPQFDLLKRQNVEDIIDRICKGKIAYVHVGLPCQSWSRARRSDGRGPGPLRDDGQFLMGLPNLNNKDREKVRQGNRLLHHTVRILRACIAHDVLWTLENPMTSRVWKTRAAKLLSKHAVFHGADFCQYNQPWRKATYFLAHPRLTLTVSWNQRLVFKNTPTTHCATRCRCQRDFFDQSC